MVKTAKYQKARLRITGDNGRGEWIEVLPSEIADSPAKGDLICVGCPVPMRKTSSFTRGSGTEVPAYLSLYPHTDHAADCRLNIETLHVDLQQVHPDTISIEDKILYLHLPDEERLKNKQSTKRRVGGGGDGETWTATMNSATAIARFLKQYDDPGDLLNRLMIRYRDHRGDISVMFWADFCFEARSPEALKYLRRLQRDGDRTPPAAVIFPVKERRESATYRYMRVDTYEKPLLDNPRHQLFLSVAEPLNPDRHRLTNIESDSILVLGHGSSFDWTGKLVTELRFTIEDQWQLAAL